MGRRGPKTAPTELKIIRGNPRKENLNRRQALEPKSPPADLAAPAHLDGVALETWNRRAPQLAAMRVLRQADLDTLERYCICAQCFRDAWLDVRASGMVASIDSGRRVANPAIAAMRGFHADLLQIEREFGLTPSSRSGMVALDATEEDPLEAFLAS